MNSLYYNFFLQVFIYGGSRFFNALIPNFCIKALDLLSPRFCFSFFGKDSTKTKQKQPFSKKFYLLKSINTSLAKPVLSMDNLHFSRMNIRAVCVLYPFLCPHK